MATVWSRKQYRENCLEKRAVTVPLMVTRAVHLDGGRGVAYETTQPLIDGKPAVKVVWRLKRDKDGKPIRKEGIDLSYKEWMRSIGLGHVLSERRVSSRRRKGKRVRENFRDVVAMIRSNRGDDEGDGKGNGKGKGKGEVKSKGKGKRKSRGEVK